MGLFSRKPHPASDYLNSEEGQRSLNKSRKDTEAREQKRRAKEVAARKKREAERQAERISAKEAEAKQAGREAYDNIMSDSPYRREAPTPPARSAAPTTQGQGLPWLDILVGAAGLATAAMVAGKSGMAEIGETHNRNAERSDETAREITDEARAALDELSSSWNAHVSWSEYPELCGLFRAVESAAQWRTESGEEEDRDTDEFSACLANASANEGLIGVGADLVEAQSSTLYRLYLKWAKSLFR